jgi:protein involved in polysaccharide export with SLBB domain
LSDIIERAGGVSANVYLPAARIFRDGQQLAMDFQKVIGDQNPKFDIILQDNDSIYFPESYFTVKVEGEVANPALQKFTEGKTVRSYLKNAGGRTKNADNIFLTQANGFTRKVGFLSDPKVDDGSVITVSAKPPKKPRESGKFLETFGTIAAIVSSKLTTVLLIQTIN